MKPPPLIFLLFLLTGSLLIKAQSENNQYKSRLNIGSGAENGYFGVDYSSKILTTDLFGGIGCGAGTGLTLYLRYEPFNENTLSPFISVGISQVILGTWILSPGKSVYSGSVGFNYTPDMNWKVTPSVSIGMSFYSVNKNNTEENELNSFSPLLKIGIAFPENKR